MNDVFVGDSRDVLASGVQVSPAFRPLKVKGQSDSMARERIHCSSSPTIGSDIFS